MSTVPVPLVQLLEQHGQTHLITGWDRLLERERSQLVSQIERLDFGKFRTLLAARDANQGNDSAARERARRARSPRQLVRLAFDAAARERRDRAYRAGEQLLREGKVGAILVAGGQGTRLGFDGPKGMFPIGPVTQRTLFHVLAEQVLARTRRAGRSIPYFIMTSDATHVETTQFFAENSNFGLNAGDVYFFQQGSLPAVDDSSQRILLASPGRISTSPDGHGGLLNALRCSGLLEVMQERGLEQLYYHQVDNPTAIVCDPAFLGEHWLQNSDMSTKVVAKTSPGEKMGVVVDLDEKTQIIEYSDLKGDEPYRRDETGQLIFWAGSTAMHVFRREFLDRLISEEIELPYHVAHKGVNHVTETGEHVVADSDRPNAHKFEQFIFDALTYARQALVVEVDRALEFNPVKNKDGADSPETCRAALTAIARQWVSTCGGVASDGVELEVSPLYALDASEFDSRGCPSDPILTSQAFRLELPVSKSECEL